MNLDRFRLLVVVGTGGVGKTTIAAALALAAAQQGKRALVLTIDPARALARSLGLAALGAEQRVPIDASGTLSAAMLDPKQAWDAFIARHAPSADVAHTLYANPFYQRLSTSFAGSTEYMAIEETCRFAESGAYDLLVLDTPPAAHALDFVHAPERIDRLLGLGPWTAWKSAGASARFVLRRLEHATGRRTLRDIAAFLAALDALVDGAIARTRRARALLRGGDAAFVLVAAPRQLVLDETRALGARLAAQPTPLAGVIINRVHAAPVVSDAASRALAALGDDPAAGWIRAAWVDACAEAADEEAAIARFAGMLPPRVPLARVAEADHDLHALADLQHVIAQLQMPSAVTTLPVTASTLPTALSR